MLPEQKFLQDQVDEIGKVIETKCNQIVKLNIQKDASHKVFVEGIFLYFTLCKKILFFYIFFF